MDSVDCDSRCEYSEVERAKEGELGGSKEEIGAVRGAYDHGLEVDARNKKQVVQNKTEENKLNFPLTNASMHVIRILVHSEAEEDTNEVQGHCVGRIDLDA
ncbi:hypothetical protein ECANGB1_1289 [Enterospora canceri]|uniref:Uncharacterized protein n=1 Tax=Enterospora canceri TaxID=1081671 RepID=A0A1Y1S6F7_9MICR|nr:hypothetical protein ECANGB1_1289 [Enterospora canceri]